MKKITISLLLVLFVSTLVFAADFVPVNKLDIDAQDHVQYNFDGSSVDIPVEVTGSPARAYLVIETTGLADTNFRVTNGRIGWHTVSSIDTTIYTSTGDDLQPGNKYITWSGNDNDGNAVAEGEYTFYIWAFDYESMVQPAVALADYDRVCAQARTLLQSEDENGVPLPKPWLTTVARGRDIVADYDTELEVTHKTWAKCLLGNDPYNPELIQTCDLVVPEGWNGNIGAHGRSPFDPEDFNNIFHWTTNDETSQQKLRKFKLVPNDVAEELTDWGQDLTWTYEITNYHTGGFDIVNNTYLVVPTWLYSESAANSNLLICSLDGDKIEDIYLKEVDKAEYVKEHGEVLQAGAPQGACAFMNDTRLAHGSIWCFQSVTDPVRYLESGDYDDLFVAINEEGDGYQDKGWAADNPFPDYCFAEDPPWNYGYWGCEDGFFMCAVQRAGPISWTLFAPDMTAVSYCAIAGETDFGQSSVLGVDVDSPYDGLYLRPRYWSSAEREEQFAGLSMMYLGADSDRGTISKSGPTSVAAAAPAAFAVAQNVPNPCNPTTTINYTIPESGNVTVDVFNVTGQKVDTLVNDYLDAGSHSVVWDGSSKSSGVYFYTVTSGEFAKTLKMTLLK